MSEQDPRFSVSFYGKNSFDFVELYLFKADDMAEFLDGKTAFQVALMERGVKPSSPSNRGGSGSGETAQTAKSDEEDAFKADELFVTRYSGKLYWQVSSQDPYPKFPVNIWEEVLDDFAKELLDNPSVDSSALDISQAYDLSGYRAYFGRNEKGNPARITKLVKI